MTHGFPVGLLLFSMGHGNVGRGLAPAATLPSPGEKVPPKGADVEFGRKRSCFKRVKDVVVRNVSERTSVFLHFR